MVPYGMSSTHVLYGHDPKSCSFGLKNDDTATATYRREQHDSYSSHISTVVCSTNGEGRPQGGGVAKGPLPQLAICKTTVNLMAHSLIIKKFY